MLLVEGNILQNTVVVVEANGCVRFACCFGKMYSRHLFSLED